MRQSDVNEAVARRVESASLSVSDEVQAGCIRYLELLEKWNRTINLTALSFEAVHLDRTVDKLIIEPLIGAQLLAASGVSPSHWIDLGSGGGSPAIPLRLACPGGSMAMVESRTRKGAFLREVVRSLALARTMVVTERFEDVRGRADASLVSMRAVRLDEQMITFTRSLLAVDGYLLSFGTSPFGEAFVPVGTSVLPDQSLVHLLRMANVPRGTLS